jgi:hypothetical protein
LPSASNQGAETRGIIVSSADIAEYLPTFQTSTILLYEDRRHPTATGAEEARRKFSAANKFFKGFLIGAMPGPGAHRAGFFAAHDHRANYGSRTARWWRKGVAEPRVRDS